MTTPPFARRGASELASRPPSLPLSCARGWGSYKRRFPGYFRSISASNPEHDGPSRLLLLQVDQPLSEGGWPSHSSFSAEYQTQSTSR